MTNNEATKKAREMFDMFYEELKIDGYTPGPDARKLFSDAMDLLDDIVDDDFEDLT